MRKMLLPVLISAALLGGCATQTVKQGKDLSSSGIAYTEAVDSLLDTTTDKIIDFDNSELIKTRRGSNLKDAITAKNEAVSDVISEINGFRSQTRLLKVYFLNLQKLSDSTVKEDMGGSVKSLSDSISKLNETLDREESLSDEQKEQISALGGLIASAVHSSKIKKALERDAEVIGTYLALQEKQLENITSVLKDRFSSENDAFLNKEVIAPYVDTSKELNKDWSENRKKWFKTKFVNDQLNTAKEAAKQLRGVWEDVVQGKSDAGSLSLIISDINEFVTTVQALKNAEKVE